MRINSNCLKGKTYLGIVALTAIIICYFFQVRDCYAHNIVIVQSSLSSPYLEALNGFLSVSVASPQSDNLKSITPNTIHKIYLKGSDNDRVKKEILSYQPDLILALGKDALQQSIHLPAEIPIVYLLVPGGKELAGDRPNVTGINMTIQPDRQIEAYTSILPDTSRIGLIYDPSKTDALVEKLRLVCRIKGIELITQKTYSSKNVYETLYAMAAYIDAFLMIPDSTVVTPNTIESLLLFSFENKIPLLTFADKYLEMGATVSATFDLYDMGTQAGNIALKILNSPLSTVLPQEHPQKMNLNLNNTVASKMGLYVNTAALGHSSAKK